MKFLLVVLVMVTCTGAIAETESTAIFRKGSWSVDFNYDPEDGSVWCSADTQRGEQALTFGLWDSGLLGIFVFDSNWDLRSRDVRFVVQIDRRPAWEMSGHAEDQSVYIFPKPDSDLRRFLEEVMAGNILSVQNESRRRVAQFSLSGSYAAVVQLFDCFRKIENGARSRSDPFGPGSDPFN